MISDPTGLDLRVEACAKEVSLFLRSRYESVLRDLYVIENSDLKIEDDLLAEGMLVQLLEPIGISCLTEERGWVGEPSEQYFLVDALDGTVNYVYGIPMFCVSVALMTDGKPILGVVVDIVSGNCYRRARGDVMYINGRKFGLTRGKKRYSEAVVLSAITPLVTNNKQSLDELNLYLQLFGKVRMLGSASWSIASVAAGKADAVALPAIRTWDVMGGHALLDDEHFNITVQYPYSDPTICDFYAERKDLF